MREIINKLWSDIGFRDMSFKDFLKALYFSFSLLSLTAHSDTNFLVMMVIVLNFAISIFVVRTMKINDRG